MVLLFLILSFYGIAQSIEKQYKIDRLDRIEDIRAINANFDELFRYLNYANVNISSSQKEINILAVSTSSFQILLNLLANSTTQMNVSIYNLQMSTIPGAVDWTAATTTFVDVSGDTMLGALKTIYYFQISTTVAGLKRIEWADGSVSTFAVTAGATNAELQAFKSLMTTTTYWIGVSTGTERTERIAKDALLDGVTGQILLSTGTVLPLNGSKSMTGNLNMGTNNITNTSTHTVVVLNVTQINWADGQTSSTSHIGDLTQSQADARYLFRTTDTINGKLTGLTTFQVPTTITNEIIYPDGSRQVTNRRAYPYIVIAAANAPQNIKDKADFISDGTEDQIEFNAAISTLATTGGIIDGCGLTFVISDSINVNQSSITIQNANILENGGGNFNSINLLSNICNISLRNLFISNNSVGGMSGVNGTSVNITDINIDNCTVVGSDNLDGFFFNYGSKITINNCIANNCSTGFYIANTTFTIISNCRTLSSTTNGYYFLSNRSLLSDKNLSDNTVTNVFDYTTNISSQIVSESWRTPTLLNSWVNYGGGAENSIAGYTKDENGFVHLRGAIKNGISGVVSTLPVGYRPEFRQAYSVACYDGVSYIVGECEILTNGNIQLMAYSNVFTSLDGITFKAFR